MKITTDGGRFELVVFPGARVEIYDAGEKLPKRVFKIGDIVEYDSYNFSYHGVIEKITDKRITVRPGNRLNTDTPRMENKAVRMTFETFSWRNHNFDFAESCAQNHETMMYI